LEAALKKHQAQKGTIHFLPPYRPEHFFKLKLFLNISPGDAEHNASVDLIKAIVSLRSIKSTEEIIEIEKAINTTNLMQMAAMRSAKQGMTEAAIAGPLQGVAISKGGNLSFPTILTTRGEVLHNHYGTRQVESGEMILCDCGAESAMHYAGDLTRTFPVDAKFSTVQKDVYTIVQHAQQVASEALKPGRLFLDVHRIACEKLSEGLKDLGLMKGDVQEAVAANAHTLFFQCGLGHMLGLDVHDMENLGEQYVGYTEDMKKSNEFGLKSLRLARALEPGFVLTVEPGLYFIPALIDQWKAEKKHTDFISYSKLESFKTFGGIRIEEDFMITTNGGKLLGDQLPKSAEAIEKIREEVLSRQNAVL
jgi:Xaa-Pro aminopeptidase